MRRSRSGLWGFVNGGRVSWLQCWSADRLLFLRPHPTGRCEFRGRRAGGHERRFHPSLLHHDVEVLGGDCVGGLVGWNSPAYTSIEACYATGMVHGINSVGGLVGQYGTPSSVEAGRRQSFGTSGVIHDCYAACSVTGQQNTGGLIGSAVFPEARQESSFFLDPKDGGGPDNGLGTPLTAAQMRQQASFAAWDFIDTWTICEGKDYPRLRWEGVKCGE